MSQSAFSSQSSRYHKSQTIRARELKFWENVHPPQHVTCHVSRVTCHVSRVTCHMSRVTCHVSHVTFFFIYFFFFWKSGEDYRWRVCYQRGLPRLVFLLVELNTTVLITYFKTSQHLASLFVWGLRCLKIWWQSQFSERRLSSTFFVCFLGLLLKDLTDIIIYVLYFAIFCLFC